MTTRRLHRFELATQWLLRAPVEPVWNAIAAADDWPCWWRHVRQVRLLREGDASGLGALRRFTWASRLPYRVHFEMEVVQVVPYRRLAGLARGELAGSGTWTFAPQGEATRVCYLWQVEVTPAWMRLLVPLARPLFAWNHDAVMRDGAAGLARHLGVALLQARAVPFDREEAGAGGTSSG